MLNSQKLVIILFGPPGSGKGTQAGLLAEKLNLYYLETSKIIESNLAGFKEENIIVDAKKYSLEREKKLWLAGKLNSPEVVTFWIENKIKELAKENKNLVLSGSPRTLYEGKKIIPLLRRLYGKENILIFELKLTANQSIFRNSHRKICQLMRHPILYTKETENLAHCPLDGSKLFERKGLDDPEIIKVRLREYQERTYPLIDYFQKEKLKVIKINGAPSPAAVFKNILSRI